MVESSIVVSKLMVEKEKPLLEIYMNNLTHFQETKYVKELIKHFILKRGRRLSTEETSTKTISVLAL